MRAPQSAAGAQVCSVSGGGLWTQRNSETHTSRTKQQELLARMTQRTLLSVLHIVSDLLSKPRRRMSVAFITMHGLQQFLTFT